MTNNFLLGRILGIELRIDYSWFVVFFMLTWSLASHYFPMVHPDWPPLAYWVIGGATSVLFFASVVAHELAHSVLSQRFGAPVRDITLFIFGGAAHISREPRNAAEEILMALAGPATSIALSGALGLVWLTTDGFMHAIAGWLGSINLMLGLFNLIPGFPLDGGRVLRALIWHFTGNANRATKIASASGQAIAFGFIAFGALEILSGNLANGLWIAFIGWFLNNAAAQSAQQVALKELLAGHTAGELMVRDCPRVQPWLKLDVVVDQIALRSGRHCFPVLENDHLLGVLTVAQIGQVARDKWQDTPVSAVMTPVGSLVPLRPGDELTGVFDRVTGDEGDPVPVMENGRLLGMLGRDELLKFISTRADLGMRRGA